MRSGNQSSSSFSSSALDLERDLCRRPSFCSCAFKIRSHAIKKEEREDAFDDVEDFLFRRGEIVGDRKEDAVRGGHFFLSEEKSRRKKCRRRAFIIEEE